MLESIEWENKNGEVWEIIQYRFGEIKLQVWVNKKYKYGLIKGAGMG